MKFLLVDDEKSALLSMKFRLSRYQIDAAIFDDETAALSAFTAAPAAFDAVVAKLAMRGIRGDTFAERVWEIEPEKPITILSGLSDQERLDDACIELGVCMVANPASISEILLSLESQGLHLPENGKKPSLPSPLPGKGSSRFGGA